MQIPHSPLSALPMSSEPVSKDLFISAMRNAPSPVCVITTQENGQRMALTISSFLSVSAEPALISVCINRQSRMSAAMTKNSVFAVHLLSADQAHIADTFAGRPQTGLAYDFSCVEWHDRGADREPIMGGVAVSLECRVESLTDAGTHRLFIAEVKNISMTDKRPLLYWNRLYGVPTHTSDA